jgi:hypothetical protein
MRCQRWHEFPYTLHVRFRVVMATQENEGQSQTCMGDGVPGIAEGAWRNWKGHRPLTGTWAGVFAKATCANSICT